MKTMRNKHIKFRIMIASIVIWSLLGAVVTMIMLLTCLVPLALLIRILGG